MAKKLKGQAKTDDRQLAEAVRASAQQIWQAGLGAFAKAQQEGGKAFAKLVEDGTDLQKQTLALADEKIQEATDTAGSVDKQAPHSWDRLEQVFEERVARSLKSLGVPSQADIQALAERLEELNRAVAQLAGKKAIATKMASTDSKPTAKKAVAKASAHKVVRKTSRVQ